jgi:hypothetical protein
MQEIKPAAAPPENAFSWRLAFFELINRRYLLIESEFSKFNHIS